MCVPSSSCVETSPHWVGFKKQVIWEVISHEGTVFTNGTKVLIRGLQESVCLFSHKRTQLKEKGVCWCLDLELPQPPEL